MFAAFLVFDLCLASRISCLAVVKLEYSFSSCFLTRLFSASPKSPKLPNWANLPLTCLICLLISATSSIWSAVMYLNLCKLVASLSANSFNISFFLALSCFEFSGVVDSFNSMSSLASFWLSNISLLVLNSLLTMFSILPPVLGAIIPKLLTIVLAIKSLSTPSNIDLFSSNINISKALWDISVAASSSVSPIKFLGRDFKPDKVLPIKLALNLTGCLYNSFLAALIPICFAKPLAGSNIFNVPMLSR